MQSCRIVVTTAVRNLAGSSYLAEDGTVWIVVSPHAPDPCHLIADLVHDAYGGQLPEQVTWELIPEGQEPPRPPLTGLLEPPVGRAGARA